MKILAATDFSTRSSRAVRQAGLLAQNQDSQLHLLHVVDDDQPENLVVMECREAEAILAEQINSVPELRGTQCRPVVVTGNPFDGILRTAAEVEADLIVMGSHRKQFLLDIFIGTTVERVIRKGTFPVLMVNNEAQRRYEKVVVPLDLTEPSANALRAARTMNLIEEDQATLIHAFIPLAKGKMYVAGADQTSMDSYVASERQRKLSELEEFLAANALGNGNWSLRVEEGEPKEIIVRVITEQQPDLLVMGTHGRSGVVKALLGSVTEAAMRSLNVDILAVPPTHR